MDKEIIGIAASRTKVEPLLNAQDVKRLLKCSLPLVYKLSKRGQIPCVRWQCPGQGNKSMLRFKAKDVFDFIEKHYKTV